MELRDCKRCLLYELADKSAYESVRSYIDALPAEVRTKDCDYEHRLSICRECDMLLSGTCRKCGCYAEVRAARKDMECPANKWGKLS